MDIWSRLKVKTMFAPELEICGSLPRSLVSLVPPSTYSAPLANCKNHGLDPESYLTEVITRLPHNATAEQAAEQAAELTPARFATALCAQGQQAA